ncbi:MAG TPA: hypothetical protein P5217_04275 [Methanoregulaceae archaeon]|nr:hypothetical protein [Methanoregulaceae archaeon]HPD75118.1 hypothetical protein [Methanoregulaceae archaeon]HRY75481.1 hypothetical protein [Methanoregulaceae archaeon]
MTGNQTRRNPADFFEYSCFTELPKRRRGTIPSPALAAVQRCAGPGDPVLHVPDILSRNRE